MTSTEYQALLKRNYQPYSIGHRRMYLAPMMLLLDKKHDILDVGFGIGWGLDEMMKAQLINRYVGYEPDRESYEYVAQRYGKTKNVKLLNAPFDEDAAVEVEGMFDPAHVFCIEVIEHVPMDGHDDFLRLLWRTTVRKGATLWLSTPESDRFSHGVRTKDDWNERIHRAGYQNVTIHREQWTTLYIAQ